MTTRIVSTRSYTRVLARRNWELYLFVAPALIYIFIFNYVPLYGIQIAFKDFSPYDGIWNSRWIGLENFERFFSSAMFWTLLGNTLALSVYSLAAGFPIPIALALLLNYCRFGRMKKMVQTVTYAPHFISTVVMVGMLQVFLSTYGGFVNVLIELLGGEPVLFMGRKDLFRHIYVWSGIWQNTGWSSVIYVAALSAVSPELHEAAIVDGASKLRRIWHIDLPSILPTVIMLLILNTGRILNVGFEKAFLMQNSANMETSEIISTYVYKIGMQNAQYSFSSAVGLFNNVVNCIILLTVNKIANAAGDLGMF